MQKEKEAQRHTYTQRITEMCVRVRMWEDMIAPTLSSPLQPHSPSWASPHTLKSHFTNEQQPSLTAGFHDMPRYHSHVRPQPQWPPRCFADKRHGQAAAACPAAMLGAHRHPAKICQDLPRCNQIRVIQDFRFVWFVRWKASNLSRFSLAPAERC